MGQRHKHADVIIAWAEGKDVQVWDECAKCWCDIVKSIPFFMGDKYRIKPPAKKYRVALFRFSSDAASTYTACTDIQEEADSYEQHRSFVRWLTDWVEYEDFEGAVTGKDNGSFVWIASEEMARTWLKQLKEMLE